MTLTRLVPALFALAVLAAPAAGQTAEDVKKLNDKLDALTKAMQELKDGIKSDSVREKVSTVDSKLDQLDQDIQAIKKDLRDLKRRVDGGTTTTLRPEFDGAASRQARVRIINSHPAEMSVVLNGMAYRLAAGEERLLRVAAGEYQLEVLQIPGERRTGELTAGQTKTFTIYPKW